MLLFGHLPGFHDDGQAGLDRGAVHIMITVLNFNKSDGKEDFLL